MKRIQKPKLEKPIINGSVDEWGYILNDNIDKTTTFIDEVIQDSTEKENELSRLDQDKIDRDELPTFVKNTVDNYIETEVKPDLTNILDEHVTTVNKPDLDSYTDAKKRELDIHEKLKEGQLNTFTTQKELQLNSYVESVNKPELTRFTESQKPIIQGYAEEGKQDVTAHTDIKKGELDAKTNELLVEQKKQLGIESSKLLETQKSELDKHEQSKEVELNNYVNNTSKVTINNFTDTQKAELNNYVNITVKPDITKHVDTEKNKSTTAITEHTDAEIERINISTDIKNKLDKGGYIGTAQDLKSLIDGRVSKSDIVNDLTTGGANKVLSAEMGKRLNTDKISRTDNTLMISRGVLDGRSTNFNSFTQSGVWKGTNMQDSLSPDYPSVCGWGLFKVERSEDSIVQTYIDNTDENTIYTRSSYNSGDTWRKWSKEINSTDFPIQKSTNGWQKLSSGFIIQWVNIGNTNQQVVNFPISFPNAVVGIHSTCSKTNSVSVAISTFNISNKGCTVIPFKTIDGTQQTTPVTIFAIGY